jgi:hypothetical protein
MVEAVVVLGLDVQGAGAGPLLLASSCGRRPVIDDEFYAIAGRALSENRLPKPVGEILSTWIVLAKRFSLRARPAIA